jgi:hypothetical protein
MCLFLKHYCFRHPDNKITEIDFEFIYEEDESLRQYICNGVFSSDIVTLWFMNRVVKIECQGSRVDHALCLTRLAKERNIMVSMYLLPIKQSL